VGDVVEAEEGVPLKNKVRLLRGLEVLRLGLLRGSDRRACQNREEEGASAREPRSPGASDPVRAAGAGGPF